MNFEITRLTNGPKHHLFGFHDLVQTNAKGDMALSLEVDDISHPPLPGESCLFGIVPSCGGEFLPVNNTHTWNYPQGSRQQWVGNSDLFTCNDRDDEGKLFAWINDARSCKSIDRLRFPVHCLSPDGRYGYWIDYNRVYACLGYGYPPSGFQDKFRISDLSYDDGVWKGDVKTGEMQLLASIAEVASCGERKIVKTGYPHYLTHLMLNPKGDRIAFLHRYSLADGGETTRLMTIGTDGGKLRCLAKGFLSHFTWISDDELFIWGAHQPQLYRMRESMWLRMPGMMKGAMLAKRLIKRLQKHRASVSTVASSGVKAATKSFLRIKDSDISSIEADAIGVLVEDGHPMANPVNRKFLISDTYPNENGIRTLMAYNVETHFRNDVGRFKMIDDKPQLSCADLDKVQSGIDRRIIACVPCEKYVFTRSGFHCDLHPRWSHSGDVAYFDSIHEGSRQIYCVRMEVPR